MRFSRSTQAFLLAGALLVPVLVAIAMQTTHSRSGPETQTWTEDANGTPAARVEPKAASAAPSSRPSLRSATAVRNGQRHPVAGTFTFWAATPRANPCASRTDAADIHRGAPVTIDDSEGHVLAISTLSAGRSDATHRGCVYRFAFTPPATDAAFSITVGTRAGLTYTPGQIAKAGWLLAMNLGLPDPVAGTQQVPVSTPAGLR